MAAALASVPACVPVANDRLKESFTSRLWLSLIAATVIHFLVFALWPDLSAPSFAVDSRVFTTLELPPDILIPDRPAPITRPARPVMADAEVSDDMTIPLTTFRDNPVETLLPPPAGSPAEDLGANPRFAPFTVAPQVLNVAEVVRVMQREYPPLLRDAGIGGTVRVFFLIGEDGAVRDTRLDHSSGHQALDDAALRVAGVYHFSAAQNRDTKVAVWVSIPITFQVR